MSLVPPVLVGVAAIMTGVFWVARRRDKNGKNNTTPPEKEGAVKK
jgi:hypothetical protein